MDQVTNLESLSFTQERIANLRGVFSEIVLCDIDYCGFFDVAFDPHIFAIVCFVVDCVAELALLVSVAETDDSPASTLTRALSSPLLPPRLILANSFPKPCVTDGCWFSSISFFAMLNKSIKDSTISFGAFLLFIILE